jgi:hypothetical protein
VVASGRGQARRSVYLLARRNYHHSLLGVFDQPTLTTNCTRRASSAVVLQSLTMLNDDFVMEQVRGLAERVARQPTGKWTEAAFRTALARPPSSREGAWCAALLKRHTEQYRKSGKLSDERAARTALVHLCHVLLNTREFLYVP